METLYGNGRKVSFLKRATNGKNGVATIYHGNDSKGTR